MGMEGFAVTGATKPCPGSGVGCLVLTARAGLEFEDGTVANANTGMWLHHVVVANSGRKDAVCEKLPERWFASGNERGGIDYTGNE